MLVLKIIQSIKSTIDKPANRARIGETMYVILNEHTQLEWDVQLESWERRGTEFDTAKDAGERANKAELEDYTIDTI